MNFNQYPYRVTVGFKNDGRIYGTETYTVLAKDEDHAEQKARTNATASAYDDTRLPDRSMIIMGVVNLSDKECSEAA